MTPQITSQLQEYVDNINAACIELGKAPNPFEGLAERLGAAYIEACKIAIERFMEAWKANAK